MYSTCNSCVQYKKKSAPHTQQSQHVQTVFAKQPNTLKRIKEASNENKK